MDLENQWSSEQDDERWFQAELQYVKSLRKVEDPIFDQMTLEISEMESKPYCNETFPKRPFQTKISEDRKAPDVTFMHDRYFERNHNGKFIRPKYLLDKARQQYNSK